MNRQNTSKPGLQKASDPYQLLHPIDYYLNSPKPGLRRAPGPYPPPPPIDYYLNSPKPGLKRAPGPYPPTPPIDYYLNSTKPGLRRTPGPYSLLGPTHCQNTPRPGLRRAPGPYPPLPSLDYYHNSPTHNNEIMTKSYQSSNLIQGSKHVTGHRSENSVISEKKSTSKSDLPRPNSVHERFNLNMKEESPASKICQTFLEISRRFTLQHINLQFQNNKECSEELMSNQKTSTKSYTWTSVETGSSESNQDSEYAMKQRETEYTPKTEAKPVTESQKVPSNTKSDCQTSGGVCLDKIVPVGKDNVEREDDIQRKMADKNKSIANVTVRKHKGTDEENSIVSPIEHIQMPKFSDSEKSHFTNKVSSVCTLDNPIPVLTTFKNKDELFQKFSDNWYGTQTDHTKDMELKAFTENWYGNPQAHPCMHQTSVNGQLLQATGKSEHSKNNKQIPTIVTKNNSVLEPQTQPETTNQPTGEPKVTTQPLTNQSSYNMTSDKLSEQEDKDESDMSTTDTEKYMQKTVVTLSKEYVNCDHKELESNNLSKSVVEKHNVRTSSDRENIVNKMPVQKQRPDVSPLLTAMMEEHLFEYLSDRNVDIDTFADHLSSLECYTSLDDDVNRDGHLSRHFESNDVHVYANETVICTVEDKTDNEDSVNQKPEKKKYADCRATGNLVTDLFNLEHDKMYCFDQVVETDTVGDKDNFVCKRGTVVTQSPDRMKLQRSSGKKQYSLIPLKTFSHEESLFDIAKVFFKVDSLKPRFKRKRKYGYKNYDQIKKNKTSESRVTGLEIQEAEKSKKRKRDNTTPGYNAKGTKKTTTPGYNGKGTKKTKGDKSTSKLTGMVETKPKAKRETDMTKPKEKNEETTKQKTKPGKVTQGKPKQKIVNSTEIENNVDTPAAIKTPTIAADNVTEKVKKSVKSSFNLKNLSAELLVTKAHTKETFNTSSQDAGTNVEPFDDQDVTFIDEKVHSDAKKPKSKRVRPQKNSFKKSVTSINDMMKDSMSIKSESTNKETLPLSCKTVPEHVAVESGGTVGSGKKDPKAMSGKKKVTDKMPGTDKKVYKKNKTEHKLDTKASKKHRNKTSEFSIEANSTVGQDEGKRAKSDTNPKLSMKVNKIQRTEKLLMSDGKENKRQKKLAKQGSDISKASQEKTFSKVRSYLKVSLTDILTDTHKETPGSGFGAHLSKYLNQHRLEVNKRENQSRTVALNMGNKKFMSESRKLELRERKKMAVPIVKKKRQRRKKNDTSITKKINKNTSEGKKDIPKRNKSKAKPLRNAVTWIKEVSPLVS